ncbi:MAG: J domain-containing protein [Gammaproteobacteria bacterium]|nr:J domain-containing protein [Gammaproteobacteria bacterium]
MLADSGDAIMHERLDALVRWLAGVKGPESESITLEFEKRDTSERQAQQLALVAIDPILFDGRDNPWTTLGLAPGTDPEAIKQRYYRLTKIYHPDRQLSAEEWLNERAEKINRAYEQVKRGRAPASAEVGPRTGFEPTFAHSRPGHGRTIAIDRREAQPGFGRWARELLGGAHRLQRNTIITAASIAAVVLTLFALQDDDPYIPRTSTNTQTTEPEPTPVGWASAHAYSSRKPTHQPKPPSHQPLRSPNRSSRPA